MESWKPIGNPSYSKAEIGEEALLSSADGESTHFLNPTAAFIWDLCDGQHSEKDIEDALRSEFEIPALVNVQADIQMTLNTLLQKGLLQPPE